MIKKEINKEMNFLENKRIEVEKQISLLPHGKLRCTSSNGSNQFYIDGKYIYKRNKDTVRMVAQREYLEKLHVAICKRITLLRSISYEYEKNDLEEIYQKQCEARKELVIPAIVSIQEKVDELMNEVYEPSVFKENDTSAFFTLKRERVRSKSEMLIANELNRYNIPYRYEMPLGLDNWGKVITVHPDFTLINRTTGKRIIFEHFGMMDSITYVTKNMQKLNLYERNNYILGDNLFITLESKDQPLSMDIVDKYIVKYFV